MNKPKHKIGRWIVLGLSCAMILFLLKGRDGIIAIYRTNKNIQSLTADLHHYQKTLDSLTKTSELLSRDTAYIEFMARKNLGMIKKGEKIIKFIEE